MILNIDHFCHIDHPFNAISLTNTDLDMGLLQRLITSGFGQSIRTYISKARTVFSPLSHRSSRSRITPILEELRSPRIEVRDSASVRLSELSAAGLTTEETIEALEAAASMPPQQRTSKGDIDHNLVMAALKSPRSEYAPVIRRLFEQYSPGAQDAALILLGRIHDTASVTATIDLIIELATTINATGIGTMRFGSDTIIEPIAYGIVLDHLQTKRISPPQLNRL
ncbi:MAG: hypothetical protein ABI876_18955, partial [Bacteroidota bacterium]